MREILGQIITGGRPAVWCRRKSIEVSSEGPIPDLSVDEQRIHYECDPPVDHRWAIFSVEMGHPPPPEVREVIREVIREVEVARDPMVLPEGGDVAP